MPGKLILAINRLSAESAKNPPIQHAAVESTGPMQPSGQGGLHCLESSVTFSGTFMTLLDTKKECFLEGHRPYNNQIPGIATRFLQACQPHALIYFRLHAQLMTILVGCTPCIWRISSNTAHRHKPLQGFSKTTEEGREGGREGGREQKC